MVSVAVVSKFNSRYMSKREKTGNIQMPTSILFNHSENVRSRYKGGEVGEN